MSTMPEMVAFLREEKVATLALIAEHLGVTVERAASDCGGLHDFGYLTRYGSGPHSLVKWEAADDDYVLDMLERARTEGAPA